MSTAFRQNYRLSFAHVSNAAEIYYVCAVWAFLEGLQIWLAVHLHFWAQHFFLWEDSTVGTNLFPD